MNTWRLLFFGVLFAATPAYPVSPCGKVKIKAGAACSSLEASLDLKGCRGEGKEEVPAQIVCEGEQAKIRYEGAVYLYQGYAKKNASGSWTAEGAVDRYVKPGAREPEAAPKKERRTVSAPPASAQVSKQPANPPPAAVAPPAVAAPPQTAAAAPKTEAPAPPALAPAPVPAPAPAPLWSFNGWFRFRAETSDKTDFVSNRSYNLLRVRPTISYSPAPYATLTFAPQFAKTFGDVAFVGTSATANASQETSGASYDPSLSVHQAFADLHPADWFRLAIGRQILSYGDELVVGASEWNNIGRSFDAGKARLSHGLGWTDLFASKTQDNNTASTATIGDKDFYGLYNGWNLGAWLKEADLYLLYLKDATSRVSAVSSERLTTQNLWTAGARFKSSIGGFDHREEATKQWLVYSGVDGLPQSGAQADAELGYALVDLPVKPRLGIEAFYSTKDYNQLFPSGHKWLGYADVLARRNVSGYAIHASSGVIEGLRASFDYHYFLRTDAEGTPFKLNGTTAIGSAARSDSKLIGTEADLVLSYQASKILNFVLGGSLFFSGNYIKEQFAIRDRLDFYYLQMEMKLQ